MKKIFIDGRAGTTGLRICERLAIRKDIEIISLPEEQRKDPVCRKKALNSADVVFLCLPDDAAREAVSMIENGTTVVIDTSTAHRTLDGWAYGFPELSAEFENRIKTSRRIAVPGCHASGFIALVKPLVDSGIISKAEKLCCHSLTGYSGGGKKMIEQYEDEKRSELLASPRQYGLNQNHKHLREMKAVTELENEPIFCPIVADFYSGMEVTVPLFASQLVNGATVQTIKDVYAKLYTGELVRYTDDITDGDGMISSCGLSGKDSMQVSVSGNDERMILVAKYDNLGKGASGTAIECLNLVLGNETTLGLNI